MPTVSYTNLPSGSTLLADGTIQVPIGHRYIPQGNIKLRLKDAPGEELLVPGAITITPKFNVVLMADAHVLEEGFMDVFNSTFSPDAFDGVVNIIDINSLYLQNLDSSVQSQLDSLYSATAFKNIIILVKGEYDFRNGYTGLDVSRMLKQFGSFASASGWSLVYSPSLPSKNLSYFEDFSAMYAAEGKRQDLLSMLDGTTEALRMIGCETVVDHSSYPELFEFDAVENPDYYRPDLESLTNKGWVTFSRALLDALSRVSTQLLQGPGPITSEGRIEGIVNDSTNIYYWNNYWVTQGFYGRYEPRFYTQASGYIGMGSDFKGQSCEINVYGDVIQIFACKDPYLGMMSVEVSHLGTGDVIITTVVDQIASSTIITDNQTPICKILMPVVANYKIKITNMGFGPSNFERIQVTGGPTVDVISLG